MRCKHHSLFWTSPYPSCLATGQYLDLGDYPCLLPMTAETVGGGGGEGAKEYLRRVHVRKRLCRDRRGLSPRRAAGALLKVPGMHSSHPS